MPKLRNISGKQLVRIFENFDFVVVGQKGSHIKMTHIYSGTLQVLVIPNHNSIAKGTLRTIYTQALRYIPERELRKSFFT